MHVGLGGVYPSERGKPAQVTPGLSAANGKTDSATGQRVGWSGVAPWLV